MVTRVGQIMTPLSVYLRDFHTIGDALTLLKEMNLPGLPLLDEQGAFKGLILRDILSTLNIENFAYTDPVYRYLCTKFIPLKEETLIENVWKLPFEVFPVFGGDQEIKGIVTKISLMETFFKRYHFRLQELEAVFNSASSAILSINKQGIITSMNPAAEGPVRARPQEAIGRYLNDVIIPSGLLEVVQTGIPEYNVKFQVGKRKYITNRTPIIQDGEVMGAVGVFQDISYLESISQELQTVKNLNSELEIIVNSAYDGILICNTEGEILRSNLAASQILETPKEELNGRTFAYLISQGYFRKNIVYRVKMEGGSVSIIETSNLGRSLLLTAHPIFDDDGNLYRVVVNIREISGVVQVREVFNKSEFKLIAQSKSFKKSLDLAKRIANGPSPIILIGEKGVGKLSLAKTIQSLGSFKDKAFYRLDCKLIPESILENELFGENISTQTDRNSTGLLYSPNLGVLYLENIGDMSLRLQYNLFHYLQNQRLKTSQSRNPIHFRIIASSNKPLMEYINKGTFLDDLYFLLNPVNLHISPLRHRKEDIRPLIGYFLKQLATQYNEEKELSQDALEFLLNYDWPGNVKELKTILEKLVVIEKSKFITSISVQRVLNKEEKIQNKIHVNDLIPIKEAIEYLEEQLVTLAMQRYGSTVKAAKALGVNQSTVVRKLQRMRATAII